MITERHLREALRAKLVARVPTRLPDGSGKPSAVLIPLFEKSGDVHVWLCRRPASMRSHSGQVAFPGGKYDKSDDSLRTTALREAHEEIGIVPSDVDVIGQLDDYFTITSFTITPFVGWVAPSTTVTPNPTEVARVFAVPLETFLGTPSGVPPFRGYSVEGEFVWGATAAIARGLGDIVREIVETNRRAG